MSIKKNNNFLPSPFTIAVLLTMVTIILTLIFGERSKQGNHFINILTFWENGIWNSSLLEFAIQMMLMLVLGHTLALSNPVKRFVHKIANFCTNTEIAATLGLFFTISFLIQLELRLVLEQYLFEQSVNTAKKIT